MKKNIYLTFAIIGLMVAEYFVFVFIAQHGFNLGLLLEQWFATPGASLSTADVFLSSFAFWLFLFSEGRRLQLRNLWLYVVVNLLIGLSLALPLFLYFRERAMEQNSTSR